MASVGYAVPGRKQERSRMSPQNGNRPPAPLDSRSMANFFDAFGFDAIRLRTPERPEPFSTPHGRTNQNAHLGETHRSA
jgi:hypothetical protein